MVGSWKKEINSVLPDELQEIGAGLYMERKNIVAVTKERDGETYECFESDSREISITDYNMIKSIEEIETDKAIDDYTMQLIEEGLL